MTEIQQSNMHDSFANVQTEAPLNIPQDLQNVDKSGQDKTGKCYKINFTLFRLNLISMFFYRLCKCKLNKRHSV